MQEKMLDSVVAYLQTVKGRWPQIAKETGLTYDWIVRVADGRISDPGVQKIQLLYDYARSRTAA